MRVLTSRDFSAVTELPEQSATQEQLARLYQRYYWARQLAAGKRVLEVACGAGQGLGLLAGAARRVFGGDYMLSLVRRAGSHYGSRVPVLCLDAQALPFASASFDLVTLFEAIYYLPDAAGFLSECRRVLASGGRVLLCTVNPEWGGFSPSALSTRYCSARELAGLLRKAGFEHVELLGGFPVRARSPAQRIVSIIRRLAVALHVVPRTLGGRKVLKRIFYGRLEPIGSEIAVGMSAFEPLVPITEDSRVGDVKIVYAAATRKSGGTDPSC